MKTIYPDTEATFLAIDKKAKLKLKIAAANNWKGCKSMTAIIEELINRNL